MSKYGARRRKGLGTSTASRRAADNSWEVKSLFFKERENYILPELASLLPSDNERHQLSLTIWRLSAKPTSLQLREESSIHSAHSWCCCWWRNSPRFFSRTNLTVTQRRTTKVTGVRIRISHGRQDKDLVDHLRSGLWRGQPTTDRWVDFAATPAPSAGGTTQFRQPTRPW